LLTIKHFLTINRFPHFYPSLTKLLLVYIVNKTHSSLEQNTVNYASVLA